jgi:hypothetical protein
VIKDGYYEVRERSDGRDSIVGRFEIKNGVVVFSREVDKWNIDRISPGPMSGYTENLISLLMKAGEITYVGNIKSNRS